MEVSGRITEGGYEFRVQDYGVGIPEEELQRVTEAFYMVDKSRSRSRNGAGLGLALCVEILRLHDSELWIDSVVDEGTCMSFVLQGKPDQPEKPKGCERHEETEGPAGPEKPEGLEKPGRSKKEAANEI